MKRSRIRHAAVAAALTLSAVATPAIASWQWVEDDPGTTTYQEPRGPGYYQQDSPTTVYREEEHYVAPVVTSTEVFRDGDCDITRTYMSDGSWTDQRTCPELRIVPPHVFIIDRIGRHFDRLRARHHGYYGD